MLLELKVCIFSDQLIMHNHQHHCSYFLTVSTFCFYLFLEIKIPIQEEEPAKLEEGVEDGTEPVYQDEEAGDMRKPSKAKPKITAFVPTFDYIEGRKKYIAFVIVSIFTLYSYVDSVIKIIPF